MFYKKLFSISKNKIKLGNLIRRSTVDEHYVEVEKILSANQMLPLGFPKHEPSNKEWLEIVLFSLDPSHQWYREPDMVMRAVDPE